MERGLCKPATLDTALLPVPSCAGRGDGGRFASKTQPVSGLAVGRPPTHELLCAYHQVLMYEHTT